MIMCGNHYFAVLKWKQNVAKTLLFFKFCKVYDFVYSQKYTVNENALLVFLFKKCFGHEETINFI